MRRTKVIQPQPFNTQTIPTRTKVTWLESRIDNAGGYVTVSLSNIFDQKVEARHFIDRLNKPVLIEEVL